MKVSKDFDSSEFACKCRRCQFDGSQAAKQLVDGLQLIRDRIGVAITVNSGLRCPAYNKAVGGVRYSVHTKGLAADISVVGASLEELRDIADKIFDCGGVGYYPEEGFIHVDCRGVRARWTKRAGKYEAWEG